MKAEFEVEDVRRLVEFCMRPESNAHKWVRIRDGRFPVVEATVRLWNELKNNHNVTAMPND